MNNNILQYIRIEYSLLGVNYKFHQTFVIIENFRLWTTTRAVVTESGIYAFCTIY